MRRKERTRQSAKPAKAKVEVKRPIVRKSRKSEGARVHDLEKRLAEALKREADALERQTATSEILRVISQSPADVQPVFDTILANALRLCEAHNGGIFTFDGQGFRMAAVVELSDEFRAYLQEAVILPGPETPLRRVGLKPRVSHVADILADPSFSPPEVYRREGMRTSLAVPMCKEGRLVGALAFHRRHVRPFSDKQIALLETFADQAVIAIENVRLFNETTEALERQMATAEILRVISQAQTDVQPVFEAIADSAMRLLGAWATAVTRYDGEQVSLAAARGGLPGSADAARDRLQLPHRPTLPPEQAVLTKRVHHVVDVETDLSCSIEFRRHAAERGFRSFVSVPMLRGNGPLGIVTVSRALPGGFSTAEIALLQTFADQAVIAVENVRLFAELEARNGDLTRALEQQTATSEILRVISSSPADLQPMLDAVGENAARLCDASNALILRVDGDVLRLVAQYGELAGPPPEEMPTGQPINRDWVTGRCVVERRTIHVHDLAAEGDEYPYGRIHQQRIGHRTTLATPLLREGVALGAILIRRMEVRPFSGSQIALLKTFADQAVIAIENVGLFQELQRKNEALTQAHTQVTEALEQQTATSEILRVISSSPGDIQPVFDAIAANAARLCDAVNGLVIRFDGQLLHLAAHHNVDPERLAAVRQAYPRPPSRGALSGRAILTRAVVHVPDVSRDSEYTLPAATTIGYRSVLAVPMMHEGVACGTILVARDVVAPFSDTHIALVETFAEQAVIAIENVRLFKELEARTHDLTRSVGELRALGEVGQAISSTLDLRTVLSTIVARATQLSGTDAGVIYEYDEQREVFLPRATEHLEAEIVETMLATPVRKGEGATGQLAEAHEPIQVPDILAAPAESRVRGALVRAGYRALLAVPLVREDHLIGGLTVIRKATGEFAPEVIDLMRTFATQSALAIQNARLFLEIEDKSRQLEAASQHKSEFLANMSHELRTPLNAVIGFSEVLRERMFGELNDKQAEYVQDINASGTHLLSLINDILDLSKIEAGRMELELADFHLPQAIENALVLVRERALRHGLTLEQSIDPGLGEIQGDERKFKQVLLNLLSNAIKFTPEGGRVGVRAASVDEHVEVAVSDTGVGIAPEDQEAVFEEFRQVGTAEKKAEGTGLGLALARKFVELHGGQIWIQSQVGLGSTFTFTIPVRHGD